MRRLVEDLSLVSRVEAKAVEIRPKPLDPKGLLEEALARFQSAFQAKGVALSLEAQDPLPQVWADEERVLQVLANLLTNALRHTPQGGEVRLRAFRRQGPGGGHGGEDLCGKPGGRGNNLHLHPPPLHGLNAQGLGFGA